jgi:peptidyl-prolyl cis-trans isomerase-like protein 2
VYSYNAVQELNLKNKNYHDLISGEKFTKHDIITLQDPQNLEHVRKRDINNFSHLKTIRQDSMNARSQSSSMSNIQSIQTVDTMKEVEAQRVMDISNGVKRKTTEEILTKKDTSYVHDIKEIYELRPLIIDVNPGQVNTDGLASSALTSTSFNLNTSNATRLVVSNHHVSSYLPCNMI